MPVTIQDKSPDCQPNFSGSTAQTPDCYSLARYHDLSHQVTYHNLSHQVNSELNQQIAHRKFKPLDITAQELRSSSENAIMSVGIFQGAYPQIKGVSPEVGVAPKFAQRYRAAFRLQKPPSWMSSYAPAYHYTTWSTSALDYSQ